MAYKLRWNRVNIILVNAIVSPPHTQIVWTGNIGSFYWEWSILQCSYMSSDVYLNLQFQPLLEVTYLYAVPKIAICLLSFLNIFTRIGSHVNLQVFAAQFMFPTQYFSFYGGKRVRYQWLWRNSGRSENNSGSIGANQKRTFFN